jgi:hypothetical protein
VHPLVATTLLSGIISFALVSCERTANVKQPKAYNKDGIQFQYPDNWKVTADSQNESMRHLVIETPGEAILIIQVFTADDSVPMSDFVREFSSNAQQELPRFATSTASTFGEPEERDGYKSVSEQFSIKAVGEGVPHTRIYKQKRFGSKMIYVVSQVASEDEDLVGAGFDQITSSLQYDSR